MTQEERYEEALQQVAELRKNGKKREADMREEVIRLSKKRDKDLAAASTQEERNKVSQDYMDAVDQLQEK